MSINRVLHWVLPRMPSPRHRGLTTMRTDFFTSVMGKLNRSKGVNGTPSQAYTNLVRDQHSTYPSGQHTLAFFTECVMPKGHVVVV